MRILLANPSYKIPIGQGYEKYFIRSGSRWPHSGIKRKGTLPHYLPFPFSLAYAAAMLGKAGFDVDVFDAIALDMDETALLSHVGNSGPDAVFFETTTPTIAHDLELARRLKETSRATVIWGGAHSSVFARELLEENACIDFIVRNEYEETLVNLALSLRDGGNLAAVAGITFRDATAVRETGPAPLIQPLDRLPFPARDKFPAPWKADPTVYWDGFCQHRPAIQMHSSRGCPYRCDFCLWNQVMFQNGRHRTFTAPRIVDEMEDVVRRYGAREIYFDDDDLVADKKHVLSLCDEIERRGLDVRWSVMGDAINLTEDVVGRMAACGCIGLKFGVETGSPRLLPALGKPVNLAKVRDVARWCARCGIKTHATFSLGLRGEDMQSIRETLAFMRKIDTDTIQVSFCTPFPGTRFYDAAKAAGELLTTDWRKYDGKASDVVSTPSLDMSAAERLRERALRAWLMHKLFSARWVARQFRYFFRILRGLGVRFIARQIASIFVDEVLLSRLESRNKT